MPGKKKSGVFVVAVVALLALLPLGYWLFVGRAPPPPPPAPPPPAPVAPKPVVLTLANVQGGVEIKHGAGGWQKASSGQTLQGSDAVRTDEEGGAVLQGGDAYEVKMEPSTEVSVGELTDSISKLMLESGMATARVKKNARHVFEVSAAGSDAVARTSGGTFAISNNGKGTVAVGTQDGEVQFFGKGKTVIVRAGEESIVHPGSAPSAPSAIPTSLLLKVRWPAKDELNTRTLVLTGTAEPGSRVQIAGKTVLVDDRGGFRMRLRLAEGKNPVVVRAKSVGQTATEDTRSLVVDTTPPKVGVDKSLWK